MNRNDFGTTRNLTAAAAIPPRRIVCFAAAEGEVELSASATAKPFVGVTGIVGAVVAKERIDVHLDGVRDIEAGGAFDQGADLTSDATGRVIAAAPAANTSQRIIGQSLAPSGAAGQFVPVRISPGALANPANA